VPGAAELALKLQEQTGCVLAELGSAIVVDRELLLSQSYPTPAPSGQPGSQPASGARGRL
jgi:hypothetical protein